ncbi:MAG: glycoside hydrolase family 13 protein [Bacteroidota bacterium]|nr:glycoside hydrolase family 13 protein [Bacteroidota bacterium]
MNISKGLIFSLIVYCCTFQYEATSQTIEKIEPPNWWAGMQNNTLQLMVYGKEIGELEIEIKHTQAKLLKTTCPGNKDYIFIDIEFKKKIVPGSIPITFLNKGKEVTTINYLILDREKNSSMREGFASNDIIYLITPDRFVNADPSNDNVKGMADTLNRKDPWGRHGGDIDGIQQHLGYIKDMGFSALWLNPVLENNMPIHSYHGYAITDFYKVDPRFGTNESFRALNQQSNELGIKPIMDMVANHCGLYHHWISSPPTEDWINYYHQPYQQTNHRKSLSIDPYAASIDKEQLIEGWFVPTMPDLNTKNSYVQKYLIQNSVWWIEYAHLRGIRMDTYLYPDETFMSDWAKTIMSEYPRFNISGEVWHDNPTIVSYWQKGKLNANGYRSNLPSLFDFPTQDALRSALTSPEKWNSGWIELYDILAEDNAYPDPNNLVVFADNHDMSRIYAQVGEDYASYAMAIAYILSIRGIPQIYYGTEMLLANKGNDDQQHGVIRADFPGGWSGDPVNLFVSGERTPLQQKAYNLIHDLNLWRRNNKAITEGKTSHYVPEKGVYVFFRYTDDNKVMVILNKNRESVSLSMDRFSAMQLGATHGREIITGKEINLTGILKLDEAGPLVIEIRSEIPKR